MNLVRDNQTWRVEGPGSDRAVVAYARLDKNQLVYEIDRGAQGAPGSPLYFRFVRSLPWKAVERQFAQSITDTSPLFAGIYNQASAAEAQGLSDVAGPGYRKASEFLLKLR